jgi:hypothetical protein
MGKEFQPQEKAGHIDRTWNQTTLIPFVQNGSRVAQPVQCLATGWRTGRSGFDPRQRQTIFPLTSVSRPALRPTQPPVQWVPGVLSQGQSAAGEWRWPLTPI